MIRYVDTHTHLSDAAFRGEEDQVVARAVAAGVTRMIHADVDSTERDGMFALVERHPGVLYPMLGLYPGSVRPGWETEFERMQEYLGRGVVAIGEIGLDYHWSVEYAAEQKEALRAQLAWARRLGLPVNIHLRDATEDFFSVLEESGFRDLRGNLHAFSGSYETFRRIQRHGDWSVGIGGVVTFKNARLAEVVRQIPLDRILLETDAPYLTPVPHRGTRNESAYLPLVAERIALLKGISIEEVAAVTTANAERLFQL